MSEIRREQKEKAEKIAKNNTAGMDLENDDYDIHGTFVDKMRATLPVGSIENIENLKETESVLQFSDAA